MSEQKILVTGAAGFIGFHLIQSLLKDNVNVIGVDNLNNYYSVKLKNDRLKILSKYKNFTFSKVDIADRKSVSDVFIKFKPNKVVNLAAQAGVRYSIENPYAYIDSNLVGFVNIIEQCRNHHLDAFIYASSSSVYGGNKKIPFCVDDNVDDPISLYAATKKSNELIANAYSHLYNINTTGLRFFTVYGPWGRPDMAIYLFTEKILKGEPIEVYNNGKMKRDFTYIDDIISGIKSSILNNYKCEIFNLGNCKSVNLMDVIELIEEKLLKKAIIKFKPMQPGDVKESFANIEKSQKMLSYKPSTNIEIGVEKFILWYKNYHK